MENFPTEILVDILSRLDLQNLLECRLISSKFNTIVQDTPLLQYLIALRSQGYENGDSVSPIPDRLRSFVAHQHAWRNPSPRLTKVSGLRIDLMNEIITHDTIISLPYLRPEQEHHHHRSVDRIFLGSSVAPERRVTVVTPDVDFEDLVCDTGQQLLVVLTPQQTEVREEGGIVVSIAYIHFLSLQDGKPHSRALNHPCLVIRSTYSSPPVRFTKMRIYGEILVFQVYHGPTKKETHAYRWPTGEYIVKWEPDPEYVVMDILTIDDEYLLAVVLQTKEPSLNLYVYTIPSRNRYTGEGQIELLAIFDLPQLTQPVSLDLDCFFFHVLGSKCNGGIGSAPSDFHPSLIFFDLTITDQDNDVQLLAPISVLTRMADAARQEQPTRIQWTEWGPEHTRFSTPPDVHDFVAIIGYRALCWDEIWDFNPHGRPNSQIAEDNTQWVTSASVTPPNAIFSQEIITRLPYKRTFIPGMPQIIEIPTSRYFFEDIDGPKVIIIKGDKESSDRIIIDVWAL